jgi:membrane protease YdiL (CAAX protease family)
MADEMKPFCTPVDNALAPREAVAVAPAPFLGLAEPAPPKPWGAWATLGWGLLAVLVGLIISFIGGLLYSFALLTEGYSRYRLEAQSGQVVLVCYVFSILGMLAFLLVPTAIRSFSYFEYLGFARTRGKYYAWALATILAFVVMEIAFSILFDRPSQSPSDMLQTPSTYLLLWFVVVVAAPLGEEMFFRGFLFRGLSGTASGPALAIVLTSLIWAAIHIQYELPEITIIFVAGLLIGWFRYRSGSIGPAIFMHFTMNFTAMALSLFIAE